MMEQNKIDFVITWVDGSDPAWAAEKNKRLRNADADKVDVRKRRFRDWDNLVYLFRGIAKYAPWVNHVYIITPKQCPGWLNVNNPRVTVIDQDDLFDDKSCLPTFNNCAVELLFHKIPGLSEQFVYFNDDMFILRETHPSDFFRNGLPCYTIAFSPAIAEFSPEGKGIFGIVAANTRLVGLHYKKGDIIRQNWKKYFDPRNGREIIKTICCLPFSGLVGFNDMHTAYSYLRSTYEEVWEKEHDALAAAVKETFRGDYSLCHYVMRYWQMAKGTVAIRSRNFSTMCEIEKLGDETKAVNCILKGKPKMICMNDNVDDDEEFKQIVDNVNKAFQIRFPEKCEFEQ